MTAPLVLSFAPQTNPYEIVVHAAAGEREIFRTSFRCRSGHTLRPVADALFCLGLYPASEIGADLHIKGPVDTGLLSRAGRITGYWRSWWPSCRNVGIRVKRVEPETPHGARGTALFFSGGVDSCFSLIEAHPRLSALITLIGVDVPLSDPDEVQRLETLAHDVAKAKGLDAVVIETDVSTSFHPFAGWIEHHGSALVAVGHLLSDHFERVLIASSGNEATWNVPWGSHPGLDPMLGSRHLAVEHHGLVSRLDKIATVATDDAMLQYLRVCNQSSSNCGVCDKCTFVMRSIDILGVKDRAVTFPAFEPRRGKLKIVDDAFLTEVERLRQCAFDARREELLQEIDEIIAAYRRRSWSRTGLKLWRNWSRVMRHRLRWQRVAA